MISAVRYPVVELRQYTLRPGQRDVLIDLFDREFIESQEADGMAIVGQFRDLDDPDRFTWIRGFASMPCRARGAGQLLRRSGLEGAQRRSQRHDDRQRQRAAAAARDRAVGLPGPGGRAPPGRSRPAPPSRILVTLYYRDRPFDRAFADFFDRQARPALIQAGATPLACLQTEPAENTFPALPVRTGENVFAWLARFPSPARLDDHLRQIGRSGDWRDRVLPVLTAMITGAPQQLRLAPTARSQLR